MNPTKVAVTGCGQIATSQHLPAYREAADAGVCSLVGLCDLDPERVAQDGKQFAVAGFQDAAEMLEKTRPGGWTHLDHFPVVFLLKFTQPNQHFLGVALEPGGIVGNRGATPCGP